MTTSTQPIRYISLDDTLALFRAELKASFPGVKFSVKRSRGTGYGWVSVRWVDGPAYDDVNAIASKYEGSGFDGSTDSSYSIEHDVNGERVRYGTKGINCSREISPEREAKALRAVLAFYGDWDRPELVATLLAGDDKTLRSRAHDVYAMNGCNNSAWSRTREVLERKYHAPDSLLAMNL